MTVFKTQMIFDCLQETFTRVTALKSGVVSYIGENEADGYSSRRQTGCLYLSTAKQTPAKITLGKTSNSAELHNRTTDALHLVLLGTLWIDEVKTTRRTGSIFKAVSLADFFHAGQDTLPRRIARKGYL